jgi:hypothetical protein
MLCMATYVRPDARTREMEEELPIKDETSGIALSLRASYSGLNATRNPRGIPLKDGGSRSG